MSLRDADGETWLYVHEVTLSQILAHIVPQRPRLNWGRSQALCGALRGCRIGFDGWLIPYRMAAVCPDCEHVALMCSFDIASLRTELDKDIERHNNQVVAIGHRSYREYFRWVRAPRVNPDDAKHIALYRETIAERGGSYFAPRAAKVA